MAFPINFKNKFQWIYVCLKQEFPAYFFNDDKKAMFGDQWNIIHYKFLFNNSKIIGGKMFPGIEKVKCIPFMVTSYQQSVQQLVDILKESGIVYYDNITLEEILRHRCHYRVINPVIFKKNGYPLVQNLIDQPPYNILFWDFDAMCQIAINLKSSDVESKASYVSLIPTVNGNDGMAICTITRDIDSVQFGLHRPDICKVIYGSSDHPINGDVIAFS